jgi:hypothetical protein
MSPPRWALLLACIGRETASQRKTTARLGAAGWIAGGRYLIHYPCVRGGRLDEYRPAWRDHRIRGALSAALLIAQTTRRNCKRSEDLPKLAFAFSILPEPEPARPMLDIGNTLAPAGWTWINFPVASGRGGAGFGYSVQDKPTIGTNFSLTDVSIWVPAAHNVDWSAPVIILQNALLNSVPGIKATAFVDQPRTEPIIDGVVIWVGGKP